MSTGTGNILHGRDAGELSQHERFDELASILARGILRLHRRATPDLEIPSESSATGLDLSAPFGPHRPRAVYAAENQNGGDA